MAKSTKTPPKSDNLTEFPAPESAIAVEETSEPHDTSAETPEPVAQPAPPPPKGPGRPKKTEESPQSDFFQQVATVRPSDWGTRIYLYLYQLEPVCDLKKSGGKAYLMRYEEPITDEHRIMIEQGSGRYRFILAKNKISADASNELARYEFEIYNRLYPPKLPREAWVPDPRNRRWEALMPPAPVAPPPPAAADTVLEGIRLGNDLRKELREELKSETPATPAVAAAVNPWDAAEKILNMRSENPMVAILQQQMKDAATAAEAERDRQFKAAEAAKDREFKLQQQLLEAKTAPANKDKSFFEQLMEFGGEKIKGRIVDGIFGGAAAAAESTTTRAARMGTLEFLSDVLPKLFESPLANAAAHKLMNSGNGNQQPNPGSITARPPNGNGNDPFQRFISDIVTPKMLMYFDAEPNAEGGEKFADVIYALFPEFFEKLQNFEHPMMPGLKGVNAIVTAYKNTPQVWPRLAPKEAEFFAFVAAFCAWKPEPDEDLIQDAEVIDNEGPIDLDAAQENV